MKWEEEWCRVLYRPMAERIAERLEGEGHAAKVKRIMHGPRPGYAVMFVRGARS